MVISLTIMVPGEKSQFHGQIEDIWRIFFRGT